MSEREEEVLVLFASQMGNSKRAAEAFCEEVTTKLSISQIQDLTGTDQEIKVSATLLPMDDFLNVKKCAWTRLVVIFVSSYGIGGAPNGGKKFRDMCEYLFMAPKVQEMLSGMKFAICGLGNSSFRTYMENPTAIEECLTKVGAKRIGEFAHADADKKGEDSQENAISRWQEGIWKPLAEALIEEPN